MEKSKPFSIQAPEQIAKDYAGNKQKIAEAMQMGIVDPTAGILAGMFIDRMRSAQMQEAAPQQTVAQQVMGGAPAQAPLAPAGGLGATAPAGPPMAPAAPPMDAGLPAAAPPMGAPPMPAPPMAGPPMGMAEGGLAALPVSEAMFDEPEEDSYAPGGIVAFAEGEEIVLTGRREPESLYGYYRDPELNMTEVIQKLYKPQDKYSTRMTEMFEAEMTPEAQKKRKKQDMWASLAELGFGMAASKSPTLFGAVGEAGMRAAPAMAERTKERRAEQRDAIKTLAQQEGFNNKESRELANAAISMSGKYGEFRDKGLDREQQLFLEKLRDARERWQTSQQVGATLGAARMNKEGYLGAENLKTQRLMMQVSTAVAKDIDTKLAGGSGRVVVPSLGNMTYQQALTKNPKAAAEYRRSLITTGVNDYLTGFSDSDPLGLNS
jgi:hypothetical protein